jgi:hypothetical protein
MEYIVILMITQLVLRCSDSFLTQYVDMKVWPGQSLVKVWSNSGQTLVKLWSRSRWVYRVFSKYIWKRKWSWWQLNLFWDDLASFQVIRSSEVWPGSKSGQSLVKVTSPLVKVWSKFDHPWSKSSQTLVKVVIRVWPECVWDMIRRWSGSE